MEYKGNFHTTFLRRADLVEIRCMWGGRGDPNKNTQDWLLIEMSYPKFLGVFCSVPHLHNTRFLRCRVSLLFVFALS